MYEAWILIRFDCRLITIVEDTLICPKEWLSLIKCMVICMVRCMCFYFFSFANWNLAIEYYKLFDGIFLISFRRFILQMVEFRLFISVDCV